MRLRSQVCKAWLALPSYQRAASSLLQLPNVSVSMVCRVACATDSPLDEFRGTNEA